MDIKQEVKSTYLSFTYTQTIYCKSIEHFGNRCSGVVAIQISIIFKEDFGMSSIEQLP